MQYFMPIARQDSALAIIDVMSSWFVFSVSQIMF
jgi:hypothetical protein